MCHINPTYVSQKYDIRVYMCVYVYICTRMYMCVVAPTAGAAEFSLVPQINHLKSQLATPSAIQK